MSEATPALGLPTARAPRRCATLLREMNDRAADENSDEALMLRYRAGDAAAFDELYARHRIGLHRFIARQCRVAERVDEIFQDVWMNLIAAAPRYRVEAQFRTWLFTIAHNKLMDYFRANAKAEAHLYAVRDDEEIDVAGSRTEEPAVQADSHRARSAILAAVEGLPAPQREAFLLSEEGGMSVAEIAAATGVTHEAAKSRLRYAIAKLRERLKDYR
jgi:RNA polymerase sigma factor (sigma-70 family)